MNQNQYKYEYCDIKEKYILLKTLFVGGNNNKYHQIASDLKDKLSKTNLLAYILSEIMKDIKINNDEYVIIASYCLKDMREISDLDVVVLDSAYSKLKDNNIGVVDTAKISTTERVSLRFPDLETETSGIIEIEFFPKAIDAGFPSDEYSLKALHEDKKIQYDDYGNPYYDIMTCIDQYSCISKKDDKYYMGDYEIDRKRIEKNISHLEKILNFYENNIVIKEYAEKQITKLKSLLE